MNELELTIASIKIQPFKDIYQMNVAFDKGTIFKKEVLDDDTKFKLQDITTAIVNDKEYTFIKLDNDFNTFLFYFIQI